MLDAYKQFYQLARKRPIDVFSEMIYGSLHKDSKVFYVDASYGRDNYHGRSRKSPFATLAAAYDACTASKGDKIIVQATHTETVTSVLTASKIGVQIIGEMVGNQRPVITGNGAIDVISLTANNQKIANLEFGVPGTDAQTADINVAAANCAILNTMHHGSTTALNKVDIITMTAAADDTLIDGVKIYNTTVEVVGGIVFEGACSRVEVRRCFVFDRIGFTGGSISDEATALDLDIHDNVFMNAKADTVVAEFGNNSTGHFYRNCIAGRHTTIMSNITLSTGMNYFENYGVEEAQKSGLLMPVVDVE